ncbi:hypothetical protein JCM13591A_20280 [Microbacterium xylanilyticum]
MLMSAGVVVIGMMIWSSFKSAAKVRELRADLNDATYGSNPSPAHVAQVNNGRSLYARGVRELANRDTSAARVTFQESARTGYLPAVTAQGIIALWSGDVNAARREWERSASGGDVAAQILLSLDADDSVEFGSHEFARALMRADDQYRKDEEAREFVLGVAGHLGFREWARARAIEEELGNP